MAKLLSFKRSRNFCLHRCTPVVISYDPSEIIFNEEASELLEKTVFKRYAHTDVGRSSGTFYFEDSEDAFAFSLIFSSCPKDKYS